MFDFSKNAILLIAVSNLLIACGGSGGGSDNDSGGSADNPSGGSPITVPDDHARTVYSTMVTKSP